MNIVNMMLLSVPLIAVAACVFPLLLITKNKLIRLKIPYKLKHMLGHAAQTFHVILEK